ncbi:MAG: flagellar brake protein, partial [Nitrosomonas sp.]|nr:flagellar brake protein [Nitrosomonas sp.]
MNLLPVQVSELTIGQPLLWDLFNQDQKKLLTRGEVLSNADEALLKKSPLFRRQEEENTSATEKPKPIKASTSKSGQFTFQDMSLKVGDKLQLKLPSNIRGECCAANNGFCKAKLIGYVDNVSILINMPQLAKLTNLSLIDGDQVTVQLFSGQYAFSFTSYIDKIINMPFKYIHLSFPSKISGQVIRKSRRIKTDIVANIKDNSASAIISNLSMTGAEIRT